MEENVSKYTNAIGSGKQAITQGQKRKGGRGMREGWEYKKLGDVCQVVTGSTPKTIISEYWDGNYPWVTPAELKGDVYISDTARHITEEAIAHTNLTLLPIGTVLLSSRAPIGKVAITTIEMYCNQGFKNLICSDAINNKYLYLWLSGKTEYLNSLGRGATFKEISKTIVENVIIPLPPLSIQKSIVTELDKINELIRLKKEQLKDYDNLAQSIFYEMFGDPVVNEKGWDFKKIGEIGTVERGAGISKKDFVEDGLPCIHYGQLHTILGPTTRHHHSCIPKSLLPKYKMAHTNDVIMAITSEDVEGSCKSTAWLGNYDIVIGSDAAILHHEQDGTFLSYYTMTKAFFNEKSKYAKGFKVTHISAKEIENIPVYLPPLALQKDFAKRIEVIEHQKENIKSTIQALETLLASRMQYWFD